MSGRTKVLNYDATLILRLAAHQKAIVRKNAKMQGQSVSEYIRDMINETEGGNYGKKATQGKTV